VTEAPQADVNPFGFPGARLHDRTPVRAALRETGAVVRVAAPAGGTVWMVTEDTLARQVFSDPRFAKDPALAPAHWLGRETTLEPPASERPSLTTTDGEDHLALRRVHAPLFRGRRLRDHTDRIAAIARELLADAAVSSRRSGRPADLMTMFVYHYPLTLLCDLLDLPITDLEKVRQAGDAMTADDPGRVRAGMSALDDLVSAAIRAAAEREKATMTGVLYERARTELGEISDGDLRYMIGGLVFVGQHTTGPALGFVIAHVLAGRLDAGADDAAVDAFVEEVLRLHPPVPHSLWRFTTEPIHLGDVHLPAGAPVLVDIEGINTHPDHHTAPEELRPTRAGPTHLTFGEGAHYCIGAGLARLELRIAVRILREDFPRARLAVPFDHLRLAPDPGTRRLATLPVRLDG
jgi:13-deoxydaunorubicin hydroxylase